MADIVWQASSYCASNGSCLEVGKRGDGWRWVRVDTDLRYLLASPDEWQAFIDGVKAGEFD